MRVVIDTNVYVSGSLWEGNEERIIDLCTSNMILNYTSIQIIEEIEKVLKKRRFQLIDKEIQRLLEIYLSFSRIVKPCSEIHIIEKDPSDNKFIECATEARCDVLITGDRHLLEIKEFCDIRIMNAKDFLDKYHGK